jgi:hypothetical protein
MRLYMGKSTAVHGLGKAMGSLAADVTTGAPLSTGSLVEQVVAATVTQVLQKHPAVPIGGSGSASNTTPRSAQPALHPVSNGAAPTQQKGTGRGGKRAPKTCKCGQSISEEHKIECVTYALHNMSDANNRRARKSLPLHTKESLAAAVQKANATSGQSQLRIAHCLQKQP